MTSPGSTIPKNPTQSLPNISNTTEQNRTAANKDDKTKDQKSLIKTVSTTEEFENFLKDAGNKYVIVEFFATWCGPCKMLVIKLQDLIEKYKDKLVAVKIDVDQLEDLAIKYEVQTMPSFMIMKDGKSLEQFFGSKTEQLYGVIEKYLGKPT